jgi:hypothetical protein
LPDTPEKAKGLLHRQQQEHSAKYKQGVDNINSNLYGVVGPIIGVSGLIVIIVILEVLKRKLK